MGLKKLKIKIIKKRGKKKMEEEIKSFSEEQKFSTTKPDLQQILKGLIVKKYKRRIKIYKINPEQ